MNRSLDLWSLELVYIRGGVYEKSARIYFAREDANRSGSTAEFGRYSNGDPKREVLEGL